MSKRVGFDDGVLLSVIVGWEGREPSTTTYRALIACHPAFRLSDSIGAATEQTPEGVVSATR
jgi:hypothetical protein